MPILKVDILGSEIKISYDEAEKEKLTKLINTFRKKLSEFPHDGKTNEKIIIFLAALKTQDELEENKKLLLENKVDRDKFNKKIELISKLNNEIIILKNENTELKNKNLINSNDDISIMEKVDNLEYLIESIQMKIKDVLN